MMEQTDLAGDQRRKIKNLVYNDTYVLWKHAHGYISRLFRIAIILTNNKYSLLDNWANYLI